MVEPGNLAVLLAFHQDRANRLPEQTQRCVYSCAASALRCGGVAWRIFCWEGEPQQKAQKRPLRPYVKATYVCTLVYTQIITSTSGATILPVRHLTTSAQHLHSNRTNRIRPRRSVMSLSFPILPNSLDIPMRYSVFLYIFGWGSDLIGLDWSGFNPQIHSIL